MNRFTRLLSAACLLCLASLSAAQSGDEPFQRETFSSSAGLALPYRLHVPELTGGEEYPLVVYLHGSGGWGSDNGRQISGGNVHGTRLWLQDKIVGTQPAFVLAPQLANGQRWAAADSADLSPYARATLELIAELQDVHPIDGKRLYVIGQSLGGMGVWDLVSKRPDMFAAGVAVCGSGNRERIAEARDVPLWAFHGAQDRTVPVQRSRELVAALEAVGGNIRYTEYPDVGHNAWERAFADPELVDWLFAQSLHDREPGAAVQSLPRGQLLTADRTAELAARFGGSVRYIESNGIRLRLVEAGQGPLVILVHGWPESWYSWRYQIQALAEAGYHAVAPDMRGYGGSTIPADIEGYNIRELTADVAGIVSAMGEESAVVVGHDWGAPIAWQSALLYPELFHAVVGLNVMYGGRAAERPVRALRQAPDEDFFYTRYFQEPGVAEAEFDTDPRALIARLYTSRSPGTPTHPPEVSDPRADAGGWLPRLGEPIELPDWLSDEDVDYYAGEFARVGFRGGINYYRNTTLNWDLTEELAGKQVTQPALFIAGELDIVNRGASQEELMARGGPHFEDLRGVHLQPGVGHRNQQQAPESSNRLLLEFLDSLDID